MSYSKAELVSNFGPYGNAGELAIDEYNRFFGPVINHENQDLTILISFLTKTISIQWNEIVLQMKSLQTRIKAITLF
jgi:hypothetical protein